ncbi:MAG: cytochrome c family protein [Proteobacteria bacterium]|nr:cytochrome c family protein [Pseudomonadota bacterium]
MKPLFALSLLFAALPALAQDIGTLTADTKKTVLPVVPKVVNAMQEAVAAKGVAGAIPVCKEQAPALIKEKRQETGWDIRRVSLKTRNAERGTPDLWEVRQLADFNIRAANGEKIDTLEKSEIVTIDGKQVFRYMKALPVGDVCLNCHGAAENFDAGLKAKLAESYPHDQATGYTKGQIRGALTVKRPL